MMNAQQVLQSSALDIIFSGRNKSYGAYELRQSYNRRMLISLGGMMAIVATIGIARLLGGSAVSAPVYRQIIVDETHVSRVDQEVKPVLIEENRMAADRPKVQTIQFSNIQVDKDHLVTTAPPSMEMIENSHIDIRTEAGDKYTGIIAPPVVETGTQIGGDATNIMKDDQDIIVFQVDVQAAFPGGNKAWVKYVQRAVEKELDAFTDRDFGTCVVKFIVDKTGRVSEVQATTMQGTKLAEIAVNAIRNGPRWIPAQQNGHYVNAYRLQPVTLKSPF